MYRKLASALLVASAISTKYAMAVSLGEVTMLSALNEPLNAEIRLSNTSDLDAAQILVALAGAAEFEEVGIERTFFHSDIKFAIELDGKGGGVVKLRSERRLNEPFLDFLVDAKWPTGRMLRSYTVLVDLPVYSQSAPVIAAASAPQVAPAASTRPVNTQSQRESVASTASASSVSSRPSAPAPVQREVAEGEYRTQRNDTLWVIAQQHNPGGDISVQQTMLAIQQLNPDAFFNGNINRLKAGVVLRMPSSDVIRDISKQAALQSVAQQNRQWQNAQLDSNTNEYTPRQSAPEREGHLRLTSAGAGSAAGRNEDGAVVGGLQEQLIAAKDQAAAAQLEKAELNSRVESLGSQVEQLKRLVELKDAELASLQQQLGKDAAAPVADAKPATQTPVEETKSSIDEAKKPAEVAPQLVKQPDAKVVAEKPKTETKPAVKPVAPQPVAEPSLLDKVLQNPIYIGAVGLLIALGVGGFLLRRRAQAEKQWQEENEHFSFDDDQNDAIEYETDASTDDNDALDDIDAEASVELEDDAVLQTGDAIGEADIYIAYTQYGHAISLLKKALEVNPADQAVRIKLLEVFVLAGNKEAFLDVFEELQVRGNRSEIAAVKEALSANDQAVEWLDEVSDDTYGVDNSASSFAVAEAPVQDDFASDINDGFLNDLDLSDDFSFESNEETTEIAAPEEVSFEEELDSTFSLDESLDLEGDLELDSALDLGETTSLETEEELTDLSAELDDLSFDLSDELSATDNVSALVEENESLEEGGLGLDLDDDLSFELSSLDETQLDAAPQVAEVEEVLSFDDLDFTSEDLSSSTPAVTASDDLSIDGESFSFDDLELGEDVSEVAAAPAVQLADEEPELSLADFDLDFDDIEPEASFTETIVTSSNEDEGFEISLDAMDFAETDAVASYVVETPVAPAFVAPAEPHVSAPIASLGDDDLSFISGSDEVATKLDLAQAYVDLGDVDGAREILLEVLKEGNDEQRTEANSLMSALD